MLGIHGYVVALTGICAGISIVLSAGNVDGVVLSPVARYPSIIPHPLLRITIIIIIIITQP